METRVVKQFKVFKLLLQPIIKGKDKKNLVAISFSKEKLLDWYENQKAEKPYRDYSPDTLKQMKGNQRKEGDEKKYFPYHKTFKEGSPLEWYRELLEPNHFITENKMKYFGLYEVWMTKEEFHQEFNYIINFITKNEIKVGEYLGDVVKYSFEKIPIPQLVGLTPELLNEIENNRN